jgi:hypothetical protein
LLKIAGQTIAHTPDACAKLGSKAGLTPETPNTKLEKNFPENPRRPYD